MQKVWQKVWQAHSGHAVCHSKRALYYCCSLGRPLNTYQPSKLQRLEYGPCAIFNHTEDYSELIHMSSS